MKLFLPLFTMLCLSTYSQTWVWGTRGGSANQLYENPATSVRVEEAYSIVTDSQKNIYFLSSVGNIDLDIDGVPESTYEPSATNSDLALVSLSCDGSFRWSKIIGGSGSERFSNLQIDSDDNIYLSGTMGNASYVNNQQHLDDDVTVPATDYRTLIMLKYSSAGQLLWYKRPEPNLFSIFFKSLSGGLQIDADGHLYWLVALTAAGTYVDGALIITDTTKPWYVLKYDGDGNFLSATSLDLQTPNTFSRVQFFRNPYNGLYFFTALDTSTDNSTWAIVGNENVTHSMFLASFATDGSALWMREDTGYGLRNIIPHNLVFDSDNNIYLGGVFAGFSSTSFMGFSIAETIGPGFLMKINPSATSLLWSTYNNKGGTGYGALALKENEIGFTNYCLGTNFTWGTQTMNVTNLNQGTEVLLARFNKNSGECLSLAKLPGNIGFYDYGCALTVDASGDYIVGGNFSGTLYFDGGAEMTNNGGQSDFFIAKYATQACSPLSVAENTFENLTHYPNPTTGLLMIDSEKPMQYELYDLQGSLVCKAETTVENSSIDLSAFKSGTYVLKIRNDYGESTVFKVVKF